jgi:formylmethanofuran dehydrogenase subunit E
MAKIAEANARMFKNVFICKKCKSKIRADPKKILEGKISCRKCTKNAFRVPRKK